MKLDAAFAVAVLTVLVSFSVVSAVSFRTGFRYGFSYGVSMEPTWKEHNFIWGFAPRGLGDIHVGDVVVFMWNGQEIVHRVTDVYGEDAIFAWGDNREACHSGQVFGYGDILFIVTGCIEIW